MQKQGMIDIDDAAFDVAYAANLSGGALVATSAWLARCTAVALCAKAVLAMTFLEAFSIYCLIDTAILTPIRIRLVSHSSNGTSLDITSVRLWLFFEVSVKALIVLSLFSIFA